MQPFNSSNCSAVIPAKAGIQLILKDILQSFPMDSSLRGNDMKRKITLKSGNYDCSEKSVEQLRIAF
jgi:hypothetical protein